MISVWRREFLLRGTNEGYDCLKEGGKLRVLFVGFFSIFLVCSLSMRIINVRRMCVKVDFCRH